MQLLPVLPIAVPMLTAALLLLQQRGTTAQRLISWGGMLALLGISVALLRVANTGDITVYLVGDWPARLGITLVLDRLAAWMVFTTTLLAVACLMHACSGWDRRAPHFHVMFQLLLMGLNGAFLTGDLFNLFVFFEVLLAASYGLLLSGGRSGRMQVGMHYVAFNIAASTLFLIALGLLYGLLGALNMAELAARIATLDPSDRVLLQSIAGLLLVVFCSKGAILPLYLWLPTTYGRSQPAVAAIFVIMTKVGLYSILRVYSLLFGETAGELAGFAERWLLPAGIATLVLGGLGAMAASRLRILAGYLVLVSAGTLFIAFALGRGESIGSGLYYLAHSVFCGAAVFLIAEHVRHHRGTDRMSVRLPMRNRTVPGTLYLIAAVAAIGLPPLSGFIGKASLLLSVPAASTIWVWGAILIASFFVLVAMVRAGSKLFWVRPEAGDSEEEPARHGPALPLRADRPKETAAIVMLLGYVVLMTVFAGPALSYAMGAGEQLMNPASYMDAVLQAVPTLREP